MLGKFKLDFLKNECLKQKKYIKRVVSFESEEDTSIYRELKTKIRKKLI